MDGLRFIPSKKNFFIPVRVVSRKFRGKFLFHLKEAWNNGEIKLFNSCNVLAQGVNFLNFIGSLYQKSGLSTVKSLSSLPGMLLATWAVIPTELLSPIPGLLILTDAM